MTLDLPGYLARIGLDESPAADGAGLAALQLAHRLAIPFENLDIPLGRGISIDPDAVFAKLVTRRRGGYCFEQNQLLLRALHAIGFDARPLLARVWLQPDGSIPPRTHTLNLVTIDGEEWIADAGFGGSFTPPMRLIPDAIETTPDGARHRLVTDAEYGWMLQRDAGAGAGFAPQYSFTLDMVAPVDLELSNHWTATRPDTRFTTIRCTSIALSDGYASLIDRTLTVHRGGISDVRQIESVEDHRAALAEHFGVALTPQEVDALGLY